MVEPALADRDVADLVLEHDLQDVGGRVVTDGAQLRDHRRRHVEAARFQHQRDHGVAGQRIIHRLGRRLPQPVMGRQRAVARAERLQPVGQQQEVLGLLVGHPHPIVDVGARKPGVREAGHGVPGEVDGVQLDVGESVQQRDPSGRRLGDLALLHRPRRQQRRLGWPRGAIGKLHGAGHCEFPGAPIRRRGAPGLGLGARVRREEHGASSGGDAGVHRRVMQLADEFRQSARGRWRQFLTKAAAAGPVDAAARPVVRIERAAEADEPGDLTAAA